MRAADRTATFCDGIARRGFLKAGFLGLGGLALADVLRAQAQAAGDKSSSERAARADAPAVRRRAKTSVIFLELAGGPSQFETYDPKPRAPSEYRGAFTAIATKLPGVFFSQHMVEQAKIADRLTVIRSIHHSNNSHDPSSHLSQTGYYKSGKKGGPNEMPCVGAVAAHFRGPNHPTVPAYVAVPKIMRNGGAAQLGRACEPFQTMDDPNSAGFQVRNLSLLKELTVERLSSRRALLAKVDSQRRLLDLQGSATAIDEFSRQAFDMLSGTRAREAFDIGREPAKLRDRYGRTTIGQCMLLARRLVEAGVTCVTVRVPGWDNHYGLPSFLGDLVPVYDRALAALVGDLYQRGLRRSVLVVAMGEFGRTPRVNKNDGRDHWGNVMSVMLAGGGLKSGVFGASNSKGEVPAAMPYRPENVLATVYRHLGIDPAQTFADLSGRPRYILEDRRVIREIV